MDTYSNYSDSPQGIGSDKADTNFSANLTSMKAMKH